MSVRVGRTHVLHGTPVGGSPFVQPGSVGYLGPTGDLTVIDSTNPYTGSGGSTWNSSEGNRFTQTNLTLDHVWIKGSMLWTGTGTLTITSSIVEGGTADYTIRSESATPTTINATDATFRWPASPAFPTNSDNGNIVAANSRPVQNLLRCDFSGQPHGIEITGSNSVVDSCWVHDLAYSASDPHLDGIFLFSGTNVVIKHNYVNVNDSQSIHTTAALFLQDTFSNGITSPTIDGNYLCGGSASLNIEHGTNIVVTNNTIDVGFFDDLAFSAPATIATWTNNKHSDGSTIPSP